MSIDKNSMNTAAAVYTQIRDSIVKGTYASGSQLKQDKLAAELGVSKIPIREALVLLEADGFVETFPGRGAIVATLSAEEAEEIYLMRIALEPVLLQHSAPQTPQIEWARAEGVLVALDTSHLSFIDWYELDREFHTLLYKNANLPRMQKMVVALHGNLARYYAVYQTFGADFYSAGEKEHRAILTACKAGHIESACEMLVSHLRRSSRALIESLRSSHTIGEEP